MNRMNNIKHDTTQIEHSESCWKKSPKPRVYQWRNHRRCLLLLCWNRKRIVRGGENEIVGGRRANGV